MPEEARVVTRTSDRAASPVGIANVISSPIARRSLNKKGKSTLVPFESKQEIAFDWTRQQVGKELEVIVDMPDPEVPGHFLARSHADAPDIDCVVRLKGKGLQTGDLVRARVTGADGYDLAARAIRIR